MDWIFEHFQVVILVVLALGSLVKTVIEKASNKRNEETWNGDGPEKEEEEEDWEYTPHRQPSVPPPVQRSAGPPPVPGSPSKTSVPSRAQVSARETAAALKHQQDLAERLRQIRATKATTTGGASLTRARVASKNQATVFKAGPMALRARLKNPAEVRQAVILKEVLGSPVGLR